VNRSRRKKSERENLALRHSDIRRKEHDYQAFMARVRGFHPLWIQPTLRLLTRGEGIRRRVNSGETCGGLG
jgi:hypothetical protein